MNKILSLAVFCCLTLRAMAGLQDSVTVYPLPDTVKAIQWMAELSVPDLEVRREVRAGILTDAVQLFLEADRKEKEIVFTFPVSAAIVATGIGMEKEKGELTWHYNWSANTSLKLMIAVAGDSAENFSLYSGYAWLPDENKWKLIGTCKINGRWGSIQQPATFYSKHRKDRMDLNWSQAWVQRSNGSWKNMRLQEMVPPVISLAGHADSVLQRQKEMKLLEEAVQSGKTDASKQQEGVYYTLLKEGTGRAVDINDTLVVHYKGSLFENGAVFDQTKDKPAVFPLKRLIRGWQVGLQMCRVGGKIKLVIPSDMAYSIRTRSPKIPPNSILVFEIEVLEAKAP